MDHRSIFVACLMGACALPALAAAAEAATAAASVGEIVVTGSRNEPPTLAATEAVKFGNAVQVVTSEDIRLSGAANLAELTQFLVKGVNIGYSPDEGEYTIRLDGGGDRDTLVIRDGVPLYDRGPALEDIWSSTIIDPHMIENVEVFRGGNSLFYGSNGGIGVVSLVSKKPEGKFKAEAGVAYGTFKSRELWGNFTLPLDREGRHSVMFYGAHQATDGPRIFNPDDFVDNVRAAGGVQKYPLSRNDVGVKYLWKIDADTQFRLGGEYTESWFQDPFPDAEVHSPNTVRYPIFDAALEHRWSPAVLTEASAYYTNPHIFNTELLPDICKVATGCINPATGARVKLGDWSGLTYPNGPFRGYGLGTNAIAGFKEMGGTIRNTVDLGYLQFVVGGQIVSYRDDSDPIFPVGDSDQTVKGLFLDARPTLAFSPDTAISLAVRQDWLGGGEGKTIWKFGVRQGLWGGAYVRANGGTSYSLPKNTELRNESSTSIGNPDLKPESTRTFNGAVGVQRAFGDAINVQLEVGAFKTEITNRIQGTSDFRVPATANFGPRNTFINNTDLTKINGLTADFNLTIGRAWRINLGYTAQNARLASGLLKDEQINETPAWFVNGTVEWTAPGRRFSVAVTPRIQGSEYVRGGLVVGGVAQIRKNFGDYKVVNMTLNYFLGDNRQHQFQLRIVNLFNEKYAERYGFGNQRFGSAFNRGEFTTQSPLYYFGYPFEGKPRAFYASYSLKL